MGGILPHICHVEHYSRLDSTSIGALYIRLVEAEASIRHDRHRVAQQEKNAPLGDAIQLGVDIYVFQVGVVLSN